MAKKRIIAKKQTKKIPVKKKPAAPKSEVQDESIAGRFMRGWRKFWGYTGKPARKP